MQRHRSHIALAVCSAIAACRSDTSAVAACTFQIVGNGREVKLFPDGRFRARDGRPGPQGWLMNREIAMRVIERVAARSTDIVVDYEHQTLRTEQNGQPAPAVAWIRPDSLVWRDGDGLYATDVRWTERGRQWVEAGEYRYLSPVFPFNTRTGEVLDLLQVALTNDPGIDELPALAEQAAARFSLDHSDPEEGDATVDKLKQLLGLAQDATDDQVNKALAALKSKLAETLGIDANAANDKVGEALAALKTKADQVESKDREIVALKANVDKGGSPDPSKYVPVETVEEMRTEIAELRSNQVEREVDELVKAGLEDGRILPAQENWARDLGKKDTAALKSYLDNAQPIAALKRTQTGGEGPDTANKNGELSENQVAICTRMGISQEDYKKQLGIGQAASQ